MKYDKTMSAVSVFCWLLTYVFLSIIAAVSVTLLDKAPSKEITDIYDAATAPGAFEGDDQ